MKKTREPFVYLARQANEIACDPETRPVGMSEKTDKRSDGALSQSEEAADWLLRLGENADDPVLLAAFDEWRACSAENRAAWDRTQKAWSLLGHVPPSFRHVWDESAAPPATGELRRYASRPWGRIGLLAAAASLTICLMLIFAPMVLIRMTADYVTAAGESRTVVLSDGSTVQLGGDSAISLGFTGDRRQVTVVAGEAFFDVTHDDKKPFIVDAGGAKVEVLGTAFDIRLTAETTDVALARGSVRASYDTGNNPAEETISPGQMLVINRDTGAMTVSAIAIEDVGAWRDGRLYVVDATIGSVVEQLRRYHTAWIALPDVTLARKRVTGVYDLRDPDRALRALIAPYGGVMREATPLVRVITRG